MSRMLDGKAVVVTGAGRGLGRAYALEAARHGAKVVVNDVLGDEAKSVVTEIKALGGEGELHIGSVADWDAAGSMVALCVQRFGKIDGLVNNAGLGYDGAPWNGEPDRLRQLVEVNLLGTLYCGVQALRRMQDQGSGSIVNISSGTQLGMIDQTAYGATKGGITSLTYGWALEGHKIGVRVNAVSPIAETPMARAWQHPDKDIIISRGTNLAANSGGSETSKPEGVAPIVACLLSDKAQRITGQCIRFDGQTVSILQPASYRDDKQLKRASWSAEELAAVLNGALQKGLSAVGMYEPKLRVPTEDPQTKN